MMNPMKKHLTMTALAVSFAFCGIATAADDKTTTTEPRAGAGKHRDPEAMFKRLDANGDGKITKDEFEKVRERMQQHRAGAKGGAATGKGQIGERFFTHLDTNNDGALSLDEFKKMGEKRAHAGGRNPDPEKLKQLRERRHAAGGGDAAKKSGAEDKPKEPSK